MGAEAARPERRLSLKKKLAFSATLLAIFLLGGELAARVLGLGDPESYGGSRLRVQWVLPPVFRATVDRSGYRPTDVRLADRFFPRARPEGGTPMRIFIFGESAVAGLGFSENASFPRALERRIAVSGGPPVVVVNCGIPQIAARQVHVVERDVVRIKKAEGSAPTSDVFVFYVGNNEFSSILAENYRQLMHGDPSLSLRLDRFFEGFRLYTTVKGLSRTLTEGLTPAIRPIFPEAVKLPNPPRVSPEEKRAAVDAYAARLRAMVLAARAAGAKPVLATVVTNQEWDAREEPKGGWLADSCGGTVPLDPGERQAKLEAAEKAASAELADATRTNVQRWDSHLRRAHVRRALGRLPEAHQDFIDAYGDDPYLLRCLPEMNARVRELARELDVPLADCERRFEEQASDGTIGYSAVYDNVHLGLAANEKVAEVVADTLVQASLLPRRPLPPDYMKGREALWTAPRDTLLVKDWIGFDDDPGANANRDGKKYITMRETLDKKIEAGQASAEELVWAGNGDALEPGGEARARDLYRQAVAKSPELAAAVAENVRWLDERPK